jgi:hypothetical protein
MAYRPLDPSHQVRYGDAYEMYTVQSTMGGTTRVSDDVYQRLTSLEHINSAGHSHDDIYGQHAMDRQSLTQRVSFPASQHARTAENDDHGDTVQPKSDISRKLEKIFGGLVASWCRVTLDSWLYEGVALAFSIGCLTTLVGLLSVYDGQETPSLPYSITLNALVSILATAAKSSMLFAIAGTLGQLKWAWFADSRELSDIQTFDDATRGPWGAIVLLCSRSIRPLASLGAAITILALAYDPFLQQLVRYPVLDKNVFSKEATTKQAISLDATSNFTKWDAAKAAAWQDLRQFDRDPACPTGECTWPAFTSLGYCSKCGDTTAETSLNCSGVVGSWNGTVNSTCEIVPEQGYPATVWQGHDTGENEVIDAIVWRVHETSGVAWNDAVMDASSLKDRGPNSSFQSGYSYLGIESPMLAFTYASFDRVRINTSQETMDADLYYFSGSGSVMPVLVEAVTCVITPCVRTYNVSVKAGRLDSVVLDTDYGISEVLGWPDNKYGGSYRDPYRCWRTSDYHGTDAPLPIERCNLGDYSGSPVVNGCHRGEATSGQIFCNPLGVWESANITDPIGLLGRERLLSTGAWSATEALANKAFEERTKNMEFGFSMDSDTGQIIRNHSFSYIMERIAASLTKAELDNSATIITGNMTTPVAHVDVAWYWFILPATLNVAAIILLLATAVLSHSRKTQLWKSSTLALLYHGLEGQEPVQDLALAKVSEMSQRASTTSAELGLEKPSGRIVLQSHSHGKALPEQGS